MNPRANRGSRPGSGGDPGARLGAWSLEGLVAVLAVLLGACCLLTAATGLASPAWLSPIVSSLMLAWAPALCVTVLAALGLALSHPKALRISAMMKRLLLFALVVVGTMGLVWLWRVIIFR